MNSSSTAAKIDRLQARREALLAQIERERAAFARSCHDIGPLLRLGDRVVALGSRLRTHPLALGAHYLGGALGRRLWWTTRAGRWWRGGRALIRLLKAR